MAKGTREKILEKALQLFNEVGYFEVGVREIARLLEISPGNLSYHFSKKEDILFALLRLFSAENQQQYDAYFQDAPTNGRLLRLMRNIFHNQFAFRGVYIGNQFVQVELQKSEGFDYQAIAARRTAAFRNIFSELHRAGQLKLKEEDVSFLVSYITLFGRFWISEATLFDKSPEAGPTVQTYVAMLAKLLSLFATEQGQRSIDAFLQENR